MSLSHAAGAASMGEWGRRARRRVASLLAVVVTAVLALVALPASAYAAPPRDPCPTVRGRIACVDLTGQRMWVKMGPRTIFGPVMIRSGRRGAVTRTGMKRIYRRVLHEFSNLYFQPMPYAQYFDRGIAFHGATGNLRYGGSYGCVNLTMSDARALWSITGVGDPVYVWGRKPGT